MDALPGLAPQDLVENIKLVVDGRDTHGDQIFGLCARMLGGDVIKVDASRLEDVIQIEVILDPTPKRTTMTAPPDNTVVG